MRHRGKVVVGGEQLQLAVLGIATPTLAKRAHDDGEPRAVIAVRRDHSVGDDLLWNLTRQDLSHAPESLVDRGARLGLVEVGEPHSVRDATLEVTPRVLSAWCPRWRDAVCSLSISLVSRCHFSQPALLPEFQDTLGAMVLLFDLLFRLSAYDKYNNPQSVLNE